MDAVVCGVVRNMGGGGFEGLKVKVSIIISYGVE